VHSHSIDIQSPKPSPSENDPTENINRPFQFASGRRFYYCGPRTHYEMTRDNTVVYDVGHVRRTAVHAAFLLSENNIETGSNNRIYPHRYNAYDFPEDEYEYYMRLITDFSGDYLDLALFPLLPENPNARMRGLFMTGMDPGRDRVVFSARTGNLVAVSLSNYQQIITSCFINHNHFQLFILTASLDIMAKDLCISNRSPHFYSTHWLICD